MKLGLPEYMSGINWKSNVRCISGSSNHW